MITSTAFAGKHYAVLGLARSGRATVDALLASGARVTAWDDNEEAREQILPGTGRGTSFAGGGGPPTLQGTKIEIDGVHGDVGPLHHVSHGSPPRSGEDLALTDFTNADLTQFDSIVVTPGLPLNRHPIAARAKAAGVEIIGDIELFARARAELAPHKVVGITGTNGKSTTTALVHHILREAGVPTLMGGNIGLPILAQDPLPKGGVYVLELSSYQLDLTQTLDCDVAVLLNTTPDHLDRYAGFADYVQSKLRLFGMQSSGHAALIGDPAGSGENVIHNHLDDLRRSGNGPVEHQVLMDTAWDRGTSFSSGALWINGRRVAKQADWPALQGPHNAWNAAIAASACQLVGLDLGAILEGLESFGGLPHRMEKVADKQGVLFVNDSKATNAEAAAPALAAYPAIRWIVGGQAKAKTLGPAARHFNHVVKAYTIGEAGPMLTDLLRAASVDVAECGTLDAAVKAAAAEARSGETVLLSPACASFDQFRDFEARGDAFRAAVEAL